MIELRKFNSDQEAIDAGFSEPMGNGEYGRPQRLNDLIRRSPRRTAECTTKAPDHQTEIEPVSDSKTNVEAMIDKAAKADKSDDAMKYAQAALNAANALCALKSETTIK